jgi:hypothetical protein
MLEHSLARVQVVVMQDELLYLHFVVPMHLCRI